MRNFIVFFLKISGSMLLGWICFKWFQLVNLSILISLFFVVQFIFNSFYEIRNKKQVNIVNELITKLSPLKFQYVFIYFIYLVKNNKTILIPEQQLKLEDRLINLYLESEKNE